MNITASNYRQWLLDNGWQYKGICGVCSIRKYKFSHPLHPSKELKITPCYNKFELKSNATVIRSGNFSNIVLQLSSI